MKKKMLVIDDDEGILDGFQAMLEDEEYEIITSQDPDYLFSLSKNQYPDLILLDVLLSGKDGRKLCRKLKEDNNTSKIPILMMSAAPDMEKSVKEACADGFLRKPFEIDEVLEAIKKHI